MRRAVLGLFVALTAVLVVVPFAGADQSETIACCGQTPMFAADDGGTVTVAIVAGAYK